jgi:CRP-like cAMP-binding protein
MRKVLYILGQLDDRDVEWMAQAGRQLTLHPGEALIREGEQNPDIFVLLDGQVDVLVHGVGQVASLGSGEILGEMSFVDSSLPSATVSARQPTRVLALDKKRMEERLRSNPGFAGRFYRALAILLADRLRETVARQKVGHNVKAEMIDEDELDDNVLEGVSMAGLRFQQMLRTLQGAAAGHTGATGLG